MLPDFRLETHFSKWEFRAAHHLTASDAESMSMRELLEYATPAQRAEFDDFWLGYTETWGAPDLRDAIATTFESRGADDVLCFAGASEGIFAANNVLLDASSHRSSSHRTTNRTRRCPWRSASESSILMFGK